MTLGMVGISEMQECGVCNGKFNEYGKRIYMITIKSTNINQQLIFISLNEPLEYTNLCSHNHDMVCDLQPTYPV